MRFWRSGIIYHKPILKTLSLVFPIDYRRSLKPEEATHVIKMFNSINKFEKLSPGVKMTFFVISCFFLNKNKYSCLIFYDPRN